MIQKIETQKAEVQKKADEIITIENIQKNQTALIFPVIENYDIFIKTQTKKILLI